MLFRVHSWLNPRVPTPDPKRGEREYFARIGEEGRRHALGKPFSDEHCLEYLSNVNALLALMRSPPARVLELGCGTGWLGQLLAQRGYEVLGVDISPDAIDLARQLQARRGLAGVSYRVGDYEDLRVDPPVDYVVFHDALHHAEDEGAALRAAYAALRPGGLVLCIEPGEGHSQAASSRRAVVEFGVHEKDMPPATIWRHAREAGFVRHAVFPWPWFATRALFHPPLAGSVTAAELRRRHWSSLFQLLKAFFRRRRRGLVVLWRD